MALGANEESIRKSYVAAYCAGIVAPTSFAGTQAELLQKISDTCDDCANFVHNANFSWSRANARTDCKACITAKYQSVLDKFQTLEVQQNATIFGKAITGTGIYIIAAAVIIALGAFILIRKMK